MSEAHAHPNYIKIWFWLLILLAISVAGPMLEIPWITVVTAFGIAAVKTVIHGISNIGPATLIARRIRSQYHIFT